MALRQLEHRIRDNWWAMKLVKPAPPTLLNVIQGFGSPSSLCSEPSFVFLALGIESALAGT
jgi:hypothetical protein